MTEAANARADTTHPVVRQRLAECLRRAPTVAHRDVVRDVFERARLEGAVDGSLGALVTALRADELLQRGMPLEPRGTGSLELPIRRAPSILHACVPFVDGTLRAFASQAFASAYFDTEGNGCFRECHDRAVLRAIGIVPVARGDVGRLVAAWDRAARAHGITDEARCELLAELFEDTSPPLSATVAARVAALSDDLPPGAIGETLALRARSVRMPSVRGSQAWFLALTKTLGLGMYRWRVEGDYVICARALESGLPILAYCQDSTSRAAHVVGLVRSGDDALLFDSGAPRETRTTIARLRAGAPGAGGCEFRTRITHLLVPEQC